MQVTSLFGIDTTVSNNSLNGIGYLFVGASKYTYLNCRTHYLSSGNVTRTIDTTSCRLSTTEVNAIRFLMDSGNITSGTISLWVKNHDIYENVNGIDVPCTPEEILEIEARNAAWEVGRTARESLQQIAALEAQVTPRRMREATLTEKVMVYQH